MIAGWSFSMTTRANGCVEIKQSTLYLAAFLITVLSLVAGFGVAWGALNSNIASHHSDKSIHLTTEDVVTAAPSRKEYEQTLKRLDDSLGNIDKRLGRIEDKVYGR